MNESSLYLTVCIGFMFMVSVGWVVFYLFSTKVSHTLKDMGVFASVVLVVFLFQSLILWCSQANYANSQASDNEVWSGIVTKKEREEVHCRHDYECNCVNVPGATDKDPPRRVCQTCYDHPYDVDWTVFTEIGNFDIDTEDRQGLEQPKKWTVTTVGEPASTVRSYHNWIKAAKFNLLRKGETEIGRKWAIPTYPISIYDGWKIDRFIADGVKVPDVKEWNRDIMTVNSKIGTTKQASVIVVMTKQIDAVYAQSIHAGWNGGAKNDVLVVIGTPTYPEISWVKVFAMTESAKFQITLEQNILELAAVDRTKIIPVIKQDIVKNFKRERMRKFEYMKNEISPSSEWFFWVTFVLTLFGCGILGFMLYTFMENHAMQSRYSRR